MTLPAVLAILATVSFLGFLLLDPKIAGRRSVDAIRVDVTPTLLTRSPGSELRRGYLLAREFRARFKAEASRAGQS